MMAIQVTSAAFDEGRPIPAKFTGDGQNSSPPLRWSKLPSGSRELVLILEDPDAPGAEPFVHWIVYGIPAETPGIPEAVDIHQTMPGAMQGRNSFGKIGYGGPAPPRGHGVHHYHFRVYALSQPLSGAPGLDKAAVVAAMSGKVLGQGELSGTYERPRASAK